MSLSNNVALINKITLETAKKNIYSDKAKVVYKEPSGKYWVKPDGFDLPIPAKTDKSGTSYNIDDEVMLNYPNAKISEAIIMCLSQVATPEATDHDFELLPLSIEETQYLYVVDWYVNRVRKFDLKGNPISNFLIQSNYYQDIAVDTSGNVYVYRYQTRRMNKYSSSGSLISSVIIPKTASNTNNTGSLTLSGNNLYFPGVFQNQTALAKYDLNLNYVSGCQSFDASIEYFSSWTCADGNYIYCYAKNKIYKFDTNLNLLATANLTNQNAQYYQQIQYYGGYIYAHKYFNYVHSIVKFPGNFADGDTITPTTVTDSMFPPAGFAINKKGIFIVHNTVSQGVLKYSLSGEFQSRIIENPSVYYPNAIFIK